MNLGILSQSMKIIRPIRGAYENKSMIIKGNSCSLMILTTILGYDAGSSKYELETQGKLDVALICSYSITELFVF